MGTVDASFQGESTDDQAGFCVKIIDDVNGDYIDDILINAQENGEGGVDSGQTYLIFGKPTGWALNKILTNSDASFIGEDPSDWSGFDLAGGGDINGDGYNDILISAPGSDDLGSDKGEVNIIFGKKSGWNIDTDLYWADASFMGENTYDELGNSIDIVGDVNGDGVDDILIGAQENDEGGINAGQTYLVFGNKSGWQKHFDISNANASFIGENARDHSGCAVAGVGDVNADGFNDFIIGANENDDGGNNAGQVYLILGRSSGWYNDTPLSIANASFKGESAGEWAGFKVSGAGDVNNDGFDDFLIGARSSTGGSSINGQVYLIFGRKSGWQMDVNLGNVNASYWGENDMDLLTICSSGGDVNGDGFDDFIISSIFNNDGGIQTGQTYLILGKATGWIMDTNLSSANASFIGENNDDRSGYSISGEGDVNGDGYDDILIGAPFNDENFDTAGQAYLVFPYNNKKPTVINYVKIYLEETYEEEANQICNEDYLYVELKGTDEDPNIGNVAEVLIYSSQTDQVGFKIRLLETGDNTGLFRGKAQVKKHSDKLHNWIGGNIGESITVESVTDSSKKDFVSVVSTKAVFIGPYLINGDGENNDTIFSNLKVYNFQFQVLRPYGLEKIKSFSFKLDCGDEHKWLPSSNKFESINNQNGYTSLDDSSSYFNLTKKIGILNINITFNWTYPISDFSHNFTMRDIDIDNMITENWKILKFNISNKLNFSGELKVISKKQGELLNNAVININDQLTWSGVKVIYENSENIYPPDDEFNVYLSDNDGDIWFDNSSEGKEISLSSMTDSKSDPNEVFTLSIIGPPQKNVLGNINFSLIIDGENISFHNLTPNNESWQTTLNPIYDINITDLGGGLVDSSSLEYRTSTDNGTTWTQWKIVFPDTHENSKTLIGTITPQLQEGIDNLLQLRGLDSLNNGYNYSTIYRIKIDVHGVIFYNAIPSSSIIHESEQIKCSIKISDQLSGVDMDSIEYCISIDDKVTWSSWEKPNITIENGSYYCYVIKNFINGSSNFIKWRAKDIAGNEYTESDYYRILIDLTLKDRIPRIRLLFPLNNSVIYDKFVDLYWELYNSTITNTKFDLFFGTSNVFNEPYIENLEKTNYRIEDLNDDETYFWTIIPKTIELNGFCLNGTWTFKVDLNDTGKDKYYNVEINGPDQILMHPNENKSVILFITNLGMAEDIIELKFGSNQLSASITLDEYSNLKLKSKQSTQRTMTITLPEKIETGEFEINITVNSLNGKNVSDFHLIKIKIEKTNGDNLASEKDLDALYLIISIVIIIVILIGIFLFLRRRKQLTTEQRNLPTFEKKVDSSESLFVKPGTISVPTNSLERISQGIQSIPESSTDSTQILKLTSATSIPSIKQPSTETTPFQYNKEILDQLEKLAELKQKGIITIEEFEQKKKDLLNLNSSG